MTDVMRLAPAARVIERAASNQFYRTAVEAIPGYREAVELRHKALRLRGGLPVTAWPPMPTSAADDLPAWLDSIAAAAGQDRDRAAQQDALTALIGDCDRNIQGAVAIADRLLAPLGADMQRLMSEVAAAVKRLDGAHTAHDVLMKGGDAATVWRDELPPLRAGYDSIREAQTWAMAGDERLLHSQSKYLDDPLANLTAIANLWDLFPAWREPAAGIQTIHVGQAPDPRPWPTNDPLAQLVWLSTSDAHVWVPTGRELDDLNAGRRHPRADPAAIRDHDDT